jgi:hypothetical protein
MDPKHIPPNGFLPLCGALVGFALATRLWVGSGFSLPRSLLGALIGLVCGWLAAVWKES